MDEIADGIFHWTAFHEGIQAPVSSYYVEQVATVIDPMEPEEGIEWFADRQVDRVALANRHHYRHADRFADRFGVQVLVNENGEHEVAGKPGVETFAFGEVAPGIIAHPVEPSWPDEGVLHIATGPGVLAIADGAIRYGGQIGFVPDEHLGDDPEETKKLLRAGYGRLLDLDFDVLLFGHGEPLASGGKDALRAFVEG